MTPERSLGIGFSGSRDGMSEFQKQSLEDKLIQLRGKFSWFHHGDCIGADAEAHEIAKRLGYKIAIHPPLNGDREAYCLGADYVYESADYLDRNRGIVNQTTFLIAAPKQMAETKRGGTWYTIKYAKKIDCFVHVLARSG